MLLWLYVIDINLYQICKPLNLSKIKTMIWNAYCHSICFIASMVSANHHSYKIMLRYASTLKTRFSTKIIFFSYIKCKQKNRKIQNGNPGNIYILTLTICNMFIITAFYEFFRSYFLFLCFWSLLGLLFLIYYRKFDIYTW